MSVPTPVDFTNCSDAVKTNFATCINQAGVCLMDPLPSYVRRAIEQFFISVVPFTDICSMASSPTLHPRLRTSFLSMLTQLDTWRLSAENRILVEEAATLALASGVGSIVFEGLWLAENLYLDRRSLEWPLKEEVKVDWIRKVQDILVAYSSQEEVFEKAKTVFALLSEGGN